MNSYDPNDNIIEKINTFKALVENFDDDVALKYLEKSGWDETKAAQLYYDDQSESLARNLHSNENRPQNTNPRIRGNDNFNENNFNHYNQVGMSDQLLQNEARPSYSIPQQEPRREERGFFSKIFMAPIDFITSIFCDRGRGDNSEEPIVISRLPSYVNDFQAYANGMKRKLGLLFVYNENEIDFLRGFVERILSLDFLTEILRENCVIHSTPLSSNQGKAIKSLIMSNNRSGFLSPAIFFTFDPANNGFNRNCILDTLQSESIDVEIFQEFLIRNIEKKENILHGGSSSSNNAYNAQASQSANLNRDEYTGLMGNAEILEQQRRDMERILREEERKKKTKEEEEKRIQREKEEKVQKEKMMEMDKKTKKERKREGLPAEPEEGNPYSALIGLRYPHDGNILKRRFLKTEKIQALYDLVESLEEKIFEESEEFDIIQTFPFKVFIDKNKTLEEEKLFPNAVLQIREKELD